MACFKMRLQFYVVKVKILIFKIVLQGIDTVDASYFITPENIERLRKAKEEKKVQVCFLKKPYYSYPPMFLLLWMLVY